MKSKIIITSLLGRQSVWRHPANSVAAVLVFIEWCLSHILFYGMTFKITKVRAMFGCKFTNGVEKFYRSFPKDVFFRIIWLQKCRRSDCVPCVGCVLGLESNTVRWTLHFSYPFNKICSLHFTYLMNVKLNPR